MDNTSTANALAKIAKDLLALADRLRAEDDPGLATTELPKAALELAERGICLVCKEKPAARGRRGLCDADYQLIKRRMADTGAPESVAIGKGWLLPKGFKKTGRPSRNPELELYFNSPANHEEAQAIEASRDKVRDRKRRKAKKQL